MKLNPRGCAECGTSVTPSRLRAAPWLLVRYAPRGVRALFCPDCMDAELDNLADHDLARAWAVVMEHGRMRLLELRPTDNAEGRTSLRRVKL